MGMGADSVDVQEQGRRLWTGIGAGGDGVGARKGMGEQRAALAGLGHGWRRCFAGELERIKRA